MTDLEAKDEINTVVNTVWTSGAVAAIVSAPELSPLRWQGKEVGSNPVGYWARVSQQIVEQPQVSMADETTHGNNKKRYETFGLVFVQMFAPKSDRNAFKQGFQICELIRNAFRSAGQGGSVWFQNARINPLPEDGSSYRWNVVAEFRYDTIA